ncbi:MAG: hypothetical protein WC184_10360 [Acidimicrobiia bacterium]
MNLLEGSGNTLLAGLSPGLDTSIGSLPHTEIHRGVDFVLARQTQLPAMPTLPNRSPMEGMIAQAAWGIAGVTIEADGTLCIDHDQLDPEAPVGDAELRGEPFLTWRHFLHAVAFRTEPIKLQLTGPVTLATALTKAGVAPNLAFKIAGRAVESRAEALLNLADALAPRAERLVFLDEPSLGGLVSEDFLWDRDEAVDLVSGALLTLERRATTGLHCCAYTDWKLLLQAGPKVLSVPVGGGVETAGENLGRFLDDGGWIAWGAIPTDAPIGLEPGRLWKQLSMSWCQLVQSGCDPIQLRAQALVTPSCGLAQHGLSQADAVLRLNRQVASQIHEQAIGVRLAIGA